VDRTESLRTEKVGTLIARFSIPSIVGLVVGALYNVIDRIFVGRGVGTEALSGVAITFPLTMIVLALGLFVGIGASALISLRLGAGKRDEAERVVGTALALSAAIGVIFVVVVSLVMRPLLVMFGGSGPTLEYAITFTQVYLPGAFFQIVSFALNNTIRAQGDPITALLSMIIGAVVNAILNPIFIFGLHLGIAGSALSTDIAQVVSLAWMFVFYLRGKSALKLRRIDIRLPAGVVASIVKIGIAPFLLQVAGSLVIILINHVAEKRGGVSGVAVMGIAYSVLNLLMMPVIGINMGVQPIVGYNYGAGNYDRVRETVKKALLSALVICTAAFVVFLVLSRQIMGLFIENDPSVVAIGTRGLRIYLAMLPVVGFQVISASYFQAINKAGRAILLNLSRQVILLIPLLLLLPLWFGFDGIWIAEPVADGLSVFISLAFLIPEMRRLSRKGQSENISF
jgi:putative MATE family efflux protein